MDLYAGTASSALATIRWNQSKALLASWVGFEIDTDLWLVAKARLVDNYIKYFFKNGKNSYFKFYLLI